MTAVKNIIVEDTTNDDEELPSNHDKNSDLVGWIMDKVDAWEDYRDTNYKSKWQEYYRLWRGIWSVEDRQRDQERSRLISPALQQAIDIGVSEIEEATFGKRRWFDIQEDEEEAEEVRQKKVKLEEFKANIQQLPPDKQQAAMLEIQNIETELDDLVNKKTNLLLEEFELNGVPASISETYLNGALYGTGISKIVVEDVELPTLSGDNETSFSVQVLPIQPDQFVIDPAARSIDEALGVAHIIDVPRHTVIQKQLAGIYLDTTLGMHPEASEDFADKEETTYADKSDFVRIVEYHGLVPRSLMPLELEEDETLVEFNFDQQDTLPSVVVDDDDLIEVIITIANDNALVKAVENPFKMKDRCFVAYQHDTVPNRFWGRGLAEKGYNAQKGLDAELRARIDGLALATYPMIGVDATKLPRGADFKVRPGRNILINGDPNAGLREFKFTPPSSMSFSQTAEFERMVQMGTGSMDSATPIGVSPRNQTASGMSIIQSGSLKRNKRTMQNIERNYLDKLVQKAMWRYMQFDNERFPVKDFKFQVHSTMGILAREVEQQQLTNLLQTAQPDSPMYWMLMKSMYENSTIESKEEMLPLIEQMLNRSFNPPPPAPDPKDELAKADLEFRIKQHQDTTRLRDKELDIKGIQAISSSIKDESDAKNKDAEGIKFIAQAEAEEVGTQVEIYRTILDQLGKTSQEQKQITTGAKNGTESTES